ncbi:hypothetical protein [Streptomyces sp. NPDC046197]
MPDRVEGGAPEMTIAMAGGGVSIAAARHRAAVSPPRMQLASPGWGL